MDGAILRNLLFNFLLMGKALFPPCCLTWDQTMVKIMKIIVTSFKRSWACTAALSASDPAAGHCWPTPPLETPGHSEAILGQSLVRSLFLSSGSGCTGPGHLLDISTVGLMTSSSKRAYATGYVTRSPAPRAPCPVSGHYLPIPPPLKGDWTPNSPFYCWANTEVLRICYTS